MERTETFSIKDLVLGAIQQRFKKWYRWFFFTRDDIDFVFPYICIGSKPFSLNDRKTELSDNFSLVVDCTDVPEGSTPDKESTLKLTDRITGRLALFKGSRVFVFCDRGRSR